MVFPIQPSLARKLGKAVAISTVMFAPFSTAFCADQSVLVRKIESLSGQLEDLKRQIRDLQQQESEKDARVNAVEKKTQDTAQQVRHVEKKVEEGSKPNAIELSGDYRFRSDSLRGTSIPFYSFQQMLPFMLGQPGAAPPQLIPGQGYRNASLLTNRLGLNIKARATEDVTVKARLLMYKTWGHETTGPVTDDAFFFDRFSTFDGNMGHVPEDNLLRVDQAYATWTNIGGSAAWFSVGRRPSTGGVPTNVRQNIKKKPSDTGGVPGLLIDYAFDGATLGIAPDIAALPGAYAKFCYGRGFDSGFTSNNALKDVNFAGINIVPYVTDNFRFELQWDRAYSIFAYPEYKQAPYPGFGPNTNLGDIEQYMIGTMGKIENLGPGNMVLFASGGMSKTHPNTHVLQVGGVPAAGLMYDYGTVPENKTGTAFYVGGRYDLQSGTKFGLEYNRGSKNWVSFAPASDDMWTSKQGVHGNVYEAYVIHELQSKPISKFGKAQFRLGYQHYTFKYTGSNNWLGAPKSIEDLNNPMNAQMLTPLKKADDIYLTFDVSF
ncbi:conserved hypothetical protein [Gammaproteobacteria bacterium]